MLPLWIKKSICAVSLMGMPFILGCSPPHDSSEVVANDQKEGMTIVAALDRYRDDNARYPRQISDLVPTYIPAITNPHYGEGRWDYNVDSTQDSFGLYMWGKKPYEKGYVFSTRSREWETVDNSF